VYKFVHFNSTLVIYLKLVFIEMLDKLITYIVSWCKILYQVFPVTLTNRITDCGREPLNIWYPGLRLVESLKLYGSVWFMVFNATFNNISVILYWSVLLVEETRVLGESHWPVASHWQTLSHNVVSSTPCQMWDLNSLNKFL
jgi:hypothetical protein